MTLKEREAWVARKRAAQVEKRWAPVVELLLLLKKGEI